jgi:hypothetical protein
MDEFIKEIPGNIKHLSDVAEILNIDTRNRQKAH